MIRSKTYLCLATLSLCVWLTGCGTAHRLDERSEHERIDGGYYHAAVYDLKVIRTSFNWGGWFGPLSIILLPVGVLDLPVSLVVDTAMIPSDIKTNRRYEREHEFWNRVHAENLTTLPREEYVQHAGLIAHAEIKKRTTLGSTPELNALYIDLIISGHIPNREGIGKWIVKHPSHDEASIRATCTAIADHYPKQDWRSGSYLREYLARYDFPEDCVERLAEAGADCFYLVSQKNLSARYIRDCRKPSK